jgi:signal transduction histidine kinase
MGAFFNSMAGRVFAILVAGILASAALTLLLASHERRAFLDDVRAFHAAERIVQIVALLEAAPTQAWPQMLDALGKSGVMAEISSAAALEGESDPWLSSRLKEDLGATRQIQAAKAPCPSDPETMQSGTQARALCTAASIGLKDGSVLRVWLSPQAERAPTQAMSHLLFYALAFAASLGLLAYLVTRMVTRPLRLLAWAAGELGNNIDRPALAESGPAEVREAASAFNLMQARLRKFIHERTQMLAAITHDLQTPLTRLRLRLEKVQDDELRGKLSSDLSATQDMIRDGLDLARSMDSGEVVQRLDFDSLLNSVCDDAVEAGQDVTLTGETGAFITAQPGAIRRCLTNLIDNAVKYGNYARLRVGWDEGRVTVRVQDGGAGIPENQLEAVFTPFFRLEGSRSRETGGTGIGLTIARNIAEKHGGKLYLRNQPQHGLEAVLELPLA